MDDGLRERKHFRLSELARCNGDSPDGRWVDVLLADKALLGQHPMGRYTIRMRKRPHTDWRTTICVVSDLQISFTRDLYVPSEPGKQHRIDARMIVSENWRLYPARLQRLLAKKDDLYTISIHRDEDAIRGILCRQDEQETRLPTHDHHSQSQVATARAGRGSTRHMARHRGRNLVRGLGDSIGAVPCGSSTLFRRGLTVPESR